MFTRRLDKPKSALPLQWSEPDRKKVFVSLLMINLSYRLAPEHPCIFRSIWGLHEEYLHVDSYLNSYFTSLL